MSSWVMPGFAEERLLGSSASGRVVAAVNLASGMRVAIKYLSPRLLASPEFLAAFRAEAALLSSLSSEHVVRLFDYVEAPGRGAAIVMELVSGVSLHQMITRQGPAGPEAALVVLKGSLLGLAAAHALGIVHRDYKPENVLVDADGESKLTDFGVAVRAGQDAAGSGTPLYMAPEQWDGAPATPATDTYAATAVFFECLTGRTPFSGGLGQLQAQHAAAAVPVELVDEPLRDLVARGMAKDPAARPADAADFVTELEATAAAAYGPGWEARGRSHLAQRAAALLLLLLPGAGTSAAGTGTATASTWLTPARTVAQAVHGWKLAVAYVGLFVGVFAVVAGGIVGISAVRGRTHSPARAAQPPAPAPAALPSIAYATTAAVYTRTGNAAPVAMAALPPGTEASQFAWSWDGRWLGWFSGSIYSGNRELHITDTKADVTHTWPCAGCSGGAFADGRLIASTGTGLTAFPEDGGPPANMSLSGAALPGGLEILASTPHDASVLFFSGSFRNDHALYETTLSGAAKLIYRLPTECAPGGDRDPGGAGLIAISPDRTLVAYGGNVIGGDAGEGSDCVTVVNLATGAASIERLPADPAQPLRISAVWVDSAGKVYATAWHQPANATRSGSTVPTASVVPHQYRLDNGRWADTGPGNIVAAGGQGGWIATLEQPASILDYSPEKPGQLVAALGAKKIVLASNVTSFSWTPA